MCVFKRAPMRKIYWVILFLFTALFSQARQIQVKSIYFRPGSFAIEKKYISTLDEMAALCRSDSFSFLKVFAFCDTTGSESFNDWLSEKRASIVVDYLLKGMHVIDSSKIYAIGMGESADIYDLHFPDAHKQERCVDIIIYYEGKKEEPL